MGNLILPVPGDQHVNHQHLPLQLDTGLAGDSLGREHLQLNDLHDQHVNRHHLPLQCDSFVPDSLAEHQLNDFHDQRVNHQHLPLQYDTSLVRDSSGMFSSGAVIDLQQLDDFPDQQVNHKHLPMQYDMIDTCSAETQTFPVELHDVATQAMDTISTCASTQTADVLVLDPAKYEDIILAKVKDATADMYKTMQGLIIRLEASERACSTAAS